MSIEYDSSWDNDSEEAYEKISEIWDQRDWLVWLKSKLKFPFNVIRKEDDLFNSPDDHQEDLFKIGHKMEVLAIDNLYDEEVVVKVKENRKTGYVPLYDLEVTPKDDINFWPVREYVVWFANR